MSWYFDLSTRSSPWFWHLHSVLLVIYRFVWGHQLDSRKICSHQWRGLSHSRWRQLIWACQLLCVCSPWIRFWLWWTVRIGYWAGRVDWRPPAGSRCCTVCSQIAFHVCQRCFWLCWVQSDKNPACWRKMKRPCAAVVTLDLPCLGMCCLLFGNAVIPDK